MNPWDMVLAILLAIWVHGFVTGIRDGMFERGARRSAIGLELAFGVIIAYLALSRWP